MATSTGSRHLRKKSRSQRSDRHAGLTKVALWVPDTTTKAFARKAHRDSVAVRDSKHADGDQAFVDAISAWNTE